MRKFIEDNFSEEIVEEKEDAEDYIKLDVDFLLEALHLTIVRRNEYGDKKGLKIRFDEFTSKVKLMKKMQ